MITIFLLYSIPDSYENFRVAIESCDKLPDPEGLKIKLFDEENSRVNTRGKDEEAGALYASSKSNRHKNQPMKANFKDSDKHDEIIKNFIKKCNYCNRAGHKASNCWFKNKSQGQSAAQRK